MEFSIALHRVDEKRQTQPNSDWGQPLGGNSGAIITQVRSSCPPAGTVVMGQEKMTKIYGTSTKLIWSGAFGFTELTDGIVRPQFLYYSTVSNIRP